MLSPPLAGGEGVSRERRQRYADEVAALSGLRQPALREALARVWREAFLPPGPWLIEGADGSCYVSADANPERILHGVGVVLDSRRSLHAANPLRIAWAIEAVEIRPGDRVLHVGAGLGYYSALIAELVGADGRVIAAEIDPLLAAEARRNLAPWPQVTVVGDALSLEPGGLDVVFASCGMATLPRPWLDALRPAGRMLLPMTGSRNDGPLLLIRRSERPLWLHARPLNHVRFYPCLGLRETAALAAFDRALAGGHVSLVRGLRLDPHPADGQCWLHGADSCLTMAEP